MPRVLIERIGGDVAQGIARCLREGLPDIKLVGIDKNPDCGWQAFVDKFIEEDYGSRYEEGIRFPRSPGGAVVYICQDKLRTQQFLEWLGVPILATTMNLPLSGYPFIFKPRFGQGSKGVTVAKDIEHARTLVALEKNGVFQEYVSGRDWTEITCPVYRFRDGRIAILQLERQLMGGFTFWAKVVKHQDVEKTCRIVAEGLGVYGAINIQMKYQVGSPRIFEINPRFSSTVYMRHKLGFTDAVWAAREAMGEKIDVVPEIKEGQVVVRVQGARVLA